MGLTDRDVQDWEVTDSHTDADGVTFIYIRQQARGLPVQGAVANFAVKDGSVVVVGDRMQVDVGARVAPRSPAIGQDRALEVAAARLGLPASGFEFTLELPGPTDFLMGASPRPAYARLVYHVVPGQRTIPLAWELEMRQPDGRHWWRMVVDAHSGEVLRQDDRTIHCSVPSGAFARGYDAMAELAVRANAGPAAAAGGGPGYRVFALPAESPNHGPHQWVADPADPQASPYGWHDTNGIAGAEYTITRGNNVYAAEDRNDTDDMGYSPEGGPGLQFDFPYVQEDGPDGYLDAAITNLFYTCNMAHDVWYRYGFDEASGNFQVMNYTGQGFGDDPVYAQAQDGGGVNNANFTTYSDGWPALMQMYIWRTSETDTFRVNSPAAVAGAYGMAVAGFGPLPPAEGITADLVLVEDAVEPVNDGCEPIINASEIAGKIAVVDRGQCLFVEKVEAVQNAGALAVVVVNNTGGAPITMGGDDADGITIPAIMIARASGLTIKNAMAQGAVNATLQGAGFASLRDSDVDNGVVLHEYGHGISVRLTGGASNTDCLWNDEQMGEGWSDWMALMLTMHPDDEPGMPRGIGTFLKDEDTDGQGIRPAPYSTDFSVNSFTYGASNTSAFQAPHPIGFLWATMLWEMTWELIGEQGLNPDLQAGTGGNNTAMQLMIDGLKLQPCSPGFVDGRDAILQADEIRFGGVHQCMIWKAFARRGLGYSASQGSSGSSVDQVEAFDLPPWCMVAVEERPAQGSSFVVAPGPGINQAHLMLNAPAPADAKVRLYGMDGRLLREMPLARGSSSLVLDMAGLSKAAYILELATEGGPPQRKRFVH